MNTNNVVWKRKNLMLLSICMFTCFILYQLYFFFKITSETGNNNYIYIRSDADKFISEQGSIKGVLSKNMVKYRPDFKNEFKCLNSEQHIPFDWVNDDFCDCADGTDEPSTNACPRGIFYCDTQYQKKPVALLTVPSGKVNDGICDCCDGSDEWLHESDKKLLSQLYEKNYRYYVATCPNVC
ncbi:uncharacterized protein LOC126370005 [Pectinophora gossypiella]|uniref:Glucosidase II beta subunit N-terminal domain-containing protein n=1 Tax=Pectinophora gossypiella TaxID=13191 RepID=A0A1E1W1I8_PECGO|nr:uncharacterized protein LOC126370005 [Pectinophora gossypiella]